jgi:CheY-like chemotaxis protein
LADPRLILIVDDDPGIREVLTYALLAEGYRVAAAENGRAALARVAAERPDLILLDMNMPTMDGWEFLGVYGASPGPHPPVVAFTAATQYLRIDPGLAEPFRLQVITKPFDLDELYAVIRWAMPGGPEGDSPPGSD